MIRFYLFLLLSTPFCFICATYSSLDCYGIPLDAKLVKLFGNQSGIFVGVGANDGMIQSNTKLLEEVYHWKGVLVEPSSDLFSKLKENRPSSICFNVALGSFEEDGIIVSGDFDGSLMASVDGNRLNREANKTVMMRSLQSILDEVQITHVNFFSLDTEGYEFKILKGIDFSKTSFDYLLIEIYKSDFDLIVSFLEERGYFLDQCLSNFSYATNPGWDGTHNDYLFVSRLIKEGR